MDEPTLAILSAVGDFAERLSLIGLLLLVAWAFLRRWVVPRATADEMATIYKTMLDRMANGWSGQLGELVDASRQTTEAVKALGGKLDESARLTQESRTRMVDSVGDLRLMLAGDEQRGQRRRSKSK